MTATGSSHEFSISVPGGLTKENCEFACWINEETYLTCEPGEQIVMDSEYPEMTLTARWAKNEDPDPADPSWRIGMAAEQSRSCGQKHI